MNWSNIPVGPRYYQSTLRVIATLKQYRHPVEPDILEIPVVELRRTADPAENAVRECIEEVGFKPGKVTELGFIYPPRSHPEIIYL